jgi:hypothetical protein
MLATRCIRARLRHLARGLKNTLRPVQPHGSGADKHKARLNVEGLDQRILLSGFGGPATQFLFGGSTFGSLLGPSVGAPQSPWGQPMIGGPGSPFGAYNQSSSYGSYNYGSALGGLASPSAQNFVNTFLGGPIGPSVNSQISYGSVVSPYGAGSRPSSSTSFNSLADQLIANNLQQQLAPRFAPSSGPSLFQTLTYGAGPAPSTLQGVNGAMMNWQNHGTGFVSAPSINYFTPHFSPANTPLWNANHMTFPGVP